MTTEQSFSQVFAQALRGHPCDVVGLADGRQPLPVGQWTRAADRSDGWMLDLCHGATLDVGCGPGRLTEALAGRGHVVLGIDVVHQAVELTRDRGAVALVRNVFDTLPGEGRWRTVLLADGNVGIGGAPVDLLRRLRELLDPRGRVVVEVAAPGVPHSSTWAALECRDLRSRPFRWAVVGVDDVALLAARAGFGSTTCHESRGRWCAVLEESSW